MAYLPNLTLITLLPLLIISHGYGEMIYEEGYTVKTVIDGNKLKINPFLAFSYPESHHILLLDDLSSVFYTLSIPLSQDSVLKRFAGKGKGYSDGDGMSAMFSKPKSFTVDSKGNVYVADKENFAIRKISRSGVTTTIAGGISKIHGRADGPGRNVTFSSNYELTFVPETCALLIMDRGNNLIRMIDLKQQDCGSPKSGLGVSAVWASAIIVPCLLGLVIGFASRPYIMPYDGFNLHDLSKSWTTYRMNLGKRTPMFYSVTKNATVNSVVTFLRKVIALVISQITLMYGLWTNRSKPKFSTVSEIKNTTSKNRLSLLDCDNSSTSGFVISDKYANQLKDLITSEADVGSSGNVLKHDVVGNDEIRPRQVDDLMQASITNFAEDVHRSSAFEGPFLGVSSVVKRK